MQSKSFSTEIGGKTMTAEFTDLAEQASGSVILRYGNTAVLATAVMSAKTRDDIDYFPLTVDYEERFYAAGQNLGSSRFIKREGRGQVSKRYSPAALLTAPSARSFPHTSATKCK
jgi:polyribonucleotide nucleotidyltransferase